MVWKLRRAIALTLLIMMLGLTGCGGNGDVPVVLLEDDETASATNPIIGAIAEVSPPERIQQLKPYLDVYEPQVRIVSPRSNETLKQTTVAVDLQVRDFPLYKVQTLGLGPHLHLFLDDQPYRAVYDSDAPIVFEDLAPGTHTLRVFASRPWHESFKNAGAYDQVTFNVFAESPDRNPDDSQPLLTYSRPQGSYGAEPIMLDFYLTNAPLHIVAQADETITDWRIRCTVNGESFVFDRWQPIYLEGFQPGKNWVKLELIDENGNLIDNAFNTGLRVINYKPGDDDGLSQLIRGDISLSQAKVLVDPSYEPPTPETQPQPIPAKPETEDSLPSATETPTAPTSIAPPQSEVPETEIPSTDTSATDEPKEPETTEPAVTEPSVTKPKTAEPDTSKSEAEESPLEATKAAPTQSEESDTPKLETPTSEVLGADNAEPQSSSSTSNQAADSQSESVAPEPPEASSLTESNAPAEKNIRDSESQTKDEALTDSPVQNQPSKPQAPASDAPDAPAVPQQSISAPEPTTEPGMLPEIVEDAEPPELAPKPEAVAPRPNSQTPSSAAPKEKGETPDAQAIESPPASDRPEAAQSTRPDRPGEDSSPAAMKQNASSDVKPQAESNVKAPEASPLERQDSVTVDPRDTTEATSPSQTTVKGAQKDSAASPEIQADSPTETAPEDSADKASELDSLTEEADTV